MQNPSGFVFLDEIFFRQFQQEMKLYLLNFHSVFIPRICQARFLGTVNVIVDAKFQKLYQELSGYQNKQVNVFFVESSAFFSEIISIAKIESSEKIVLILPENLLISSEEIDNLISSQNKKNPYYSFNHKNFKNNGYATGLGAEIIDLSLLKKIVLTQPSIKTRQNLSEVMQPELDTGAIDVSPESAAPEVDLSFRTLTDFHDIIKIIQKLKDAEPGVSWSKKTIFQIYRNFHSIKTVVLVENVEGVNRAVQWMQCAGGIIQVVSLHPSSSYALERLKITYKNKDNFYDAHEVSQFGMDNFHRIHELSRMIDCAIINQFDIRTIRPGDDNFLNIKILLDSLFSHAKTIQKIIQYEKPDSLRIFTLVNKEKKNIHPISDEESIYTEILKSDGWNVPVYISNHEEKGNLGSSDSINYFHKIIPNLSQLLRSNSFLFNIGLTYKKHGFFITVKMVVARMMLQSGYNVLIYNSGYNWDECLPNLFSIGISKILRLHSSDLKKIQTYHKKNRYSEDYVSTISNVIRQFYKKELVLFYPIDISDIISERLSTFIGDCIDECDDGYNFVQEYLTDNNIRCVLMSVHPSALDNTVVRATRNAQIPVVSWQHGGAGYTYLPIMPHIEFGGSDLHLVFGEGVAKSYTYTCEKYRYVNCPPFRPVGSAAVDRILKSNISKIPKFYKKRQVLFVTTSYIHNYLGVYTPLNQNSWDEHVWLIQKRILNLSQDFPDFEFVVKLHPSHTSRQPLKMYYEDHAIKNVKFILNEKSLAELIRDSDILIFDTISTGILESLTTTKDLFVYSGLTLIDEVPLTLLKKRAHVSDDPDLFFNSLNQYLLTGFTSGTIDNHNTEFLEQFGVYKLDHNCSNRASEEIRKIIADS